MEKCFLFLYAGEKVHFTSVICATNPRGGPGNLALPPASFLSRLAVRNLVLLPVHRAHLSYLSLRWQKPQNVSMEVIFFFFWWNCILKRFLKLTRKRLPPWRNKWMVIVYILTQTAVTYFISQCLALGIKIWNSSTLATPYSVFPRNEYFWP